MCDRPQTLRPLGRAACIFTSERLPVRNSSHSLGSGYDAISADRRTMLKVAPVTHTDAVADALVDRQYSCYSNKTVLRSVKHASDALVKVLDSRHLGDGAILQHSFKFPTFVSRPAHVPISLVQHLLSQTHNIPNKYSKCRQRKATDVCSRTKTASDLRKTWSDTVNPRLNPG